MSVKEKRRLAQRAACSERHPGQSSRRKVRSVMVSSTWFWDSSLLGSCCHDDGVQKRVERIETRSPPRVPCTAPSERRSTGRHSSAPRQDVTSTATGRFASDILPKSFDASLARSSSPTSREKHRVAWNGRSPGDLGSVENAITCTG